MEKQYDATVDSVLLPPMNTRGVSKPPIQLVTGTTPRLSNETAELLRNRLKAATIVLGATMLVALLDTLIRLPRPFIFIRILILVVLVVSGIALHSRLRLPLIALRSIELTVFGAIGLQITLVVSESMISAANAGQETGTMSLYSQNLAAWTVLIFIYGIFMPNSWKRAAAVMIPAACIPYIIGYYLRWTNENIARIVALDEYSSPVPLPFLAAFAGIYAAHIINTIRREAFKARRMGQYSLKAKLGAGGMGEVYEAEHMLLKRPCALKLIRPDRDADPRTLARFELEVKATAALTHWNTVEIYDYGRTDDGTFYYVMELLPGRSLDDIVEKYGPMPPARVVHFLRQTCAALSEAHAAGLIHRDIKPANIVASERGGVFDVAKLLDFGLVRQTDTGTNPTITRDGGIVGTPYYMSPEHILPDAEVDTRSDIYSLGAVGYFLLTGRPPFVGKTQPVILAAHCRQEPDPPSRRRPDVPDDLDRLILRCLEKRPKDRFQRADQMEAALAECACANDWSTEDAFEWWQQEDRMPVRGEELRPPAESDNA